MPLYPFVFPEDTHERLDAGLRERLQLYINEGHKGQLSPFLEYLLQGQPVLAALHADRVERSAMGWIYAYGWDLFPSDCWGSAENFGRWTGLSDDPLPEPEYRIVLDELDKPDWN
ncbi:hypothetical protein [Deinococcus geothermalis]|uniref:hypothetical protein n=1 Tax=Deinococcus geothermalis TaxID=68909 RepID=UPI00031B898D|nr:hypothetical protein [Deinococcus geothermalis]